MISPGKIEEWIHEVEERPASAALIIQYIANRLAELAAREEELSAENIELLSGRKVEEYENRIASLEYQLELLKRQLGGEAILPVDVPEIKPVPEMVNLVLFNPLGQVLRVELDPTGLFSSKQVGKVMNELAPGGMQPSFLATSSQEELLYIFDSGRTVPHPAVYLTAADANNLDWEHATIEEPRVKEELVAILPIARMSLYETCIQASRRGYVKKMKTSFFTAHLTEGYIGTGVKLPADKTCGLTFASKDDLFVMVSREGFIFSMKVERLPTAIDEVIRLGITDHIVAFFTVSQKPSILFVTQNGKVVNRDASWLEPAGSFKSKGQSLLSRDRRQAGTRIVGAAPAGEDDWGVFLHSDGTLTVHRLDDLLASGNLLTGQSTSLILSMASFQLPEIKG